MDREWIDCHVHVLEGGIPELNALAESQRAYGYTGSCFLSVEAMGDCAQNALGILFKCLDPAHYAFGGLHYRFAYDFAEEAERLYDLGFDGIKMIENKPTERRRLGYAQEDARYAAMYRRASELGIPFLIHVNDPRDFWDPEKAPRWAVEAGYAYTEADPSFDRLLEETVHMLEQYPNLPVCFAHLLFLSDDGPLLRSLMDRFPQMRLDITPGTEMYHAFTEKPAWWRRFFLDYQDRILYGTDNCNRVGAQEQAIGETLNRLERRFLLEQGRFLLWDREIQGAGLPEAVVDKIVAQNFRRFAGPRPRPVRPDRAKAYLQERLQNPAYRLTDREKTLVAEVCRALDIWEKVSSVSCNIHRNPI